MPGYANDTTVSIDRSKAEIEKILKRYSATAFMYATQSGKAMIAFQISGRHIKMMLPLPLETDSLIRVDGRNHKRNKSELERAIDQETRRRWRALALIIKAKLEAVQSGIAILEDEFLAYIVLPSGESVGSWMRPQIAAAYEKGGMPALLPAFAKSVR